MAIPLGLLGSLAAELARRPIAQVLGRRVGNATNDFIAPVSAVLISALAAVHLAETKAGFDEDFRDVCPMRAASRRALPHLP